MKTLFFWIISFFCVILIGYTYGHSKAKTQIIEKQVEVIKYVAQKRAKIQAQPNAKRDELIELMRNNKL